MVKNLNLIGQDQDSLLVRRRNDNHSPGPVIRELVPSSHLATQFSALYTGFIFKTFL